MSELKEYQSSFTGPEVDSLLTKVKDGSLTAGIKKELAKKADKSGYYPSMRVGLSDNLPDRRDVTEGFIGFRESAGVGNSIEDGTAEVVELLGNSVVWNQKVKGFASWNLQGGTIEGNEAVWSAGNRTGALNAYSNTFAQHTTHKYLISADVKASSTNVGLGIYYVGYPLVRHTGSGNYESLAIITSGTGDGVDACYLTDVSTSGYGEIRAKNYRCIDLTKMFGAGYEPTTIEEFYANIPNGIDPYAYNEGEVIGVNMTGIKSANDNAWDEEWEHGDVSGSTGVEMDSTVTWRNKGYIRILPNENYCIYIQSSARFFLRARFYDADKNFIGIVSASNTDIYTNEAFKTASNAHYMRFAPNKSLIAEGTQMCVSLVHSGYKTDYVPHEEDVMPFNMPKELPCGMHNIKGASDSVKKDEVVRRIGVADLGVRASEITPSLCYNGEYRWRLWIEPNIKPIEANDIPANMMSVFDLGTADSTYLSKNGIAIDTENLLWIYDSRYVNQSDKDAMVELLQGKKLYYELAEPIVTKLDSQLNLSYKVWDFGTEELLCDQPSTNVRVRTIYGFNATDTIRGNKTKVNEHEVKIDKIESTMVQKDEYAPRLTSGFSDDLVGRGESVPAEFSFRASGGKSIKDGSARIKRLKGNSVVWNQWAKSFEEAYEKPYQGGITYNGNKVTIDNWKAYHLFRFDIKCSTAKDHLYLVLLNYANTNPDQLIYMEFGGENSFPQNIGNIACFHRNIIYNNAYKDAFTLYLANTLEGTVTLSDLQVIDLTQMFGAGNEPTTIEEYNARKPIVEDENAYNEGEVIHMTAEGVKSVGDNAWDEEWEVGGFSADGVPVSAANRIRSRNYIEVLANEEYYSNKYLTIFFYDDEMRFLSYIDMKTFTFTTPSGCRYIKLYLYGTEDYNHDILLSLYHSGWKQDTDAKYQPYWEDRLMFDKRIKDEFPDGMSRWDMVYNKNGKGYIVKGSGAKSLKGLEWKSPNGGLMALGIFNAIIEDMRPMANGEAEATYRRSGVLSPYAISSEASFGEGMEDKSMWRQGSQYGVVMRNTAFTTIADFKASFTDKDILYYELAEPTIIEYDEPFNLDYKVADFGTEEIIAEQPSAPISADIIYQFNAVDMIREHELEITELQRIIATMQAQLASLTSNNGGQ